MTEVRLKGFKSAVRKMERMAREAGDETASGTRIMGEAVATDVKSSRPGSGIPKATGVLASSIRVTGPDAQEVVKLTAGGAAAPYALAQHERTDYHHDLGEARYWIRGLERAVAGQVPEKALEEVMDEVVRIGKVTR